MEAFVGQDSGMLRGIGLQLRIEQNQVFADKRGGVRRISGVIDQTFPILNTQCDPSAFR
jgi:hypothetical protein